MEPTTIVLCYLVFFYFFLSKETSELHGCVVQFFQDRCCEEIIFNEAILRIYFNSEIPWQFPLRPWRGNTMSCLKKWKILVEKVHQLLQATTLCSGHFIYLYLQYIDMYIYIYIYFSLMSSHWWACLSVLLTPGLPLSGKLFCYWAHFGDRGKCPGQMLAPSTVRSLWNIFRTSLCQQRDRRNV